MKKILTLIIALFFGVGTLADNHSESYRGMDLSKSFGIQFEVCELRDGKTMAEVN